MERNDFIELLTKIGEVASNLPSKNIEGENKPSGSFLESTKTEKPQVIKVEHKNRAEKAKPSLDAIIQMINRHNALKQKIAKENQKI